VVETTTLERLQGVIAFEGSNPSLSAVSLKKRFLDTIDF
jgi:hypothetical protein